MTYSFNTHELPWHTATTNLEYDTDHKGSAKNNFIWYGWTSSPNYLPFFLKKKKNNKINREIILKTFPLEPL